MPTTSVLFGDERVDTNLRHGGRIRVGHLLGEFSAIEATYFGLGDGANTGNFLFSSQGNPILARPFFNIDPGENAEDAQLVAFPSVLDGTISTRTNSEAHSVSVLFRHNLVTNSAAQFDFVGGYRFFRFREALDIREDLVVTESGGLVAQGTRILVNDNFATENDFHGGEVGVAVRVFAGRATLDGLFKLGLGSVDRQLGIRGNTVSIAPGGGGTAVAQGGLLALPTNIGQYRESSFAFLPEMNLNLRYEVSDCLTCTVGYTLLFMTDIFRTGDQIDRVVNGTQIPGGGAPVPPNRPGALLNDTTLWAQGVNAGVLLTY